MPLGEYRKKLGKYLTLDKEYLNLIFEGKKVTTIRRGLIVPSTEIVYLKCDGKMFGELKILSTKYVRARDLTDKDAKLDGFKDKRELMEKLLKYYPDLKPEEWMTIIKFKLLRKMNGITDEDLARLALAYGLFKDERERRILSAVARGVPKETMKEVMGFEEREVIKVMKGILKKLKEKGVI
ncbi:MAG: hypothetical protein B6U69_00545 [Thermofilum sp. ex4484_15]|nr:MAG: hypothetical protein B6U69_00545 [Thermofilum sp. ex4484_15]